METASKYLHPGSDEYFLQQYIQNFPAFYDETDIAFIKNLDYVYEIATMGYAKMLLCENSIELVNKHDSELNYREDTYLLSKIRHYDDKTMIEGITSRHLVALNVKGCANIILNKCKPLRNPLTNKVIGMLSVLEPLHSLNIVKFIMKNSPQIRQTDATYFSDNAEISLTTRQKMVLFLVINFLSNSEIQIVLNASGFQLSLSRINTIFSDLKKIFRVNSKEELIEKAIRLNYHSQIPHEFLPKIFYDIDDYRMILI